MTLVKALTVSTNNVATLLCGDTHAYPYGRFKKTMLIENSVNAIPVNTGAIR